MMMDIYGSQQKTAYAGITPLKINFLIIISLIISATIFPIFGSNVQNYLRFIIPKSIWMEFNDFQYSRIEIWQKGIEIIFHNPIFGTGAGSFPKIFRLETGLWKGHAHNLPLELIVSYGIPAGIMILIPIFLITFNSFNIRKLKEQEQAKK